MLIEICTKHKRESYLFERNSLQINIMPEHILQKLSFSFPSSVTCILKQSRSYDNNLFLQRIVQVMVYRKQKTNRGYRRDCTNPDSLLKIKFAVPLSEAGPDLIRFSHRSDHKYRLSILFKRNNSGPISCHQSKYSNRLILQR